MADLKTNPLAMKNLKSVVSTAESCTNVLRNIINDFIVNICFNFINYRIIQCYVVQVVSYN